MKNKINCPNCEHEIDVENAITGKIEAQLKKEYADKLKEQDKIIDSKLEEMIKKEKEKIVLESKKEFSNKLKLMEEENEKNKKENKELKEKELELMKKEAALKKEKEDLELKMKKEMLLQTEEIKKEGEKEAIEKFKLKEIEYEKKFKDQNNMIDDMKRKMEQGSMQLQGEVQELALESLLSQVYPFDSIDEVAKGVKGADCIQHVFNKLQQNCGSIVYESKRTKSFSGDWIDKLKQDQLSCKADHAILVTQTLPKDMNGFGMKDGVWVCQFNDVKSVSFAIREIIIQTHGVKTAQVNKGDKMELLYQYLTSSEFVQNIKRIVENYDAMIEQLNSEKKSMHKIWAAREKQIWIVQENISSLFGSISGIAGKELNTSSLMELNVPVIE